MDASESLSSSRYALITDDTTFAPKAPSGTAFHDHLAGLPLPVGPTPRPPSRSGGVPPGGPAVIPAPVVHGDGTKSRTPVGAAVAPAPPPAPAKVFAPAASAAPAQFLEKPAIGLWHGE